MNNDTTTEAMKQGPKQQDCSINNNSNSIKKGGKQEHHREKATHEPKSKQYPTLFIFTLTTSPK